MHKDFKMTFLRKSDLSSALGNLWMKPGFHYWKVQMWCMFVELDGMIALCVFLLFIFHITNLFMSYVSSLKLNKLTTKQEQNEKPSWTLIVSCVFSSCCFTDIRWCIVLEKLHVLTLVEQMEFPSSLRVH